MSDCRKCGISTEGILIVQRTQLNLVTGLIEKIHLEIQALPSFPKEYTGALIRKLERGKIGEMPYLIDGHNLIPKLGLRLDSIDDEMELIAILQEFCRLEHRQIEVFFDGAPAAQAGTRKQGAITAHFVRLGDTADNAIRNRLKKLGKGAKNWTVVSSDRQVQVEARAAQAEVVSSDSFAGMLKHARASAPKPDLERKLSPKEVDDWLKLFEERRRKY